MNYSKSKQLMAYVFKNIGLFKIDCFTPDQTCQIYVELVLCRYEHCEVFYFRNSNKNSKTRKEALCALSCYCTKQVLCNRHFLLSYWQRLLNPDCNSAIWSTIIIPIIVCQSMIWTTPLFAIQVVISRFTVFLRQIQGFQLSLGNY